MTKLRPSNQNYLHQNLRLPLVYCNNILRYQMSWHYLHNGTSLLTVLRGRCFKCLMNNFKPLPKVWMIFPLVPQSCCQNYSKTFSTLQGCWSNCKRASSHTTLTPPEYSRLQDYGHNSDAKTSTAISGHKPHGCQPPTLMAWQGPVLEIQLS